MAVSLRELKALQDQVRELARALAELIRVEEGEQKRASTFGEPAPRTARIP